MQRLYRERLQQPGSAAARAELHTQFHAVEKMDANPLAMKW